LVYLFVGLQRETRTRWGKEGERRKKGGRVSFLNQRATSIEKGKKNRRDGGERGGGKGKKKKKKKRKKLWAINPDRAQRKKKGGRGPCAGLSLPERKREKKKKKT